MALAGEHSDKHYETFLTETDFAVAARWGLDHVRIPVDYELVETEGGIQKKADFNGSHSALHGAENMVCT